MKKKLLLCLLVILGVSFGFSQDKGNVGFLFKSGSINSVGLSFNLSDSLTLRPSFGFSTGKDEREYDTVVGGTIDTVNTTTKSTYYSVNLGLFYHFLKKNHLSAYTGLDVGYSHEKNDGEICVAGVCGFENVKSRGYNGNIIMGLQYNLNKHLAVFGEVGFGFRQYKIDNDEDFMPVYFKSTNWSLGRSGFGIILYL